MSEKKTLDKIKSGILSRGFALARVAASAGVQTATHALTTVLDSEDRRAQKFRELLVAQAGKLTTELGQLKGSLMKVGQQLSIYGERFLPPEVNQILKQLQSQSPPMSWPAISAVLEKELGADRLAKLTVETEPAAAASLGQVHRAVIRATGETIALKIQYPGVAEAIDSDLKALRSFLALSALLPKGPDVDVFFEEVRTMLHQETDYEQEARWTSQFGEWLARDARYAVPKVFSEFSTARVLATSWEEGVAADGPEVHGLSQERRDRLGQIFLELYLRELMEFHTVQSDPHFGNYRVRIGSAVDGSEDRMVLLDFGAVRQLPETFLSPYIAMTFGAYRQDRIEIIRAAQKLGFLRPDDGPERVDPFIDLCLLIGEPFHSRATCQPEGVAFFDDEGRYDWGNSDLPSRVVRAGTKILFHIKSRTPPREAIFNDRKISGVFIFVSSLGARLHSAKILERALSKRS